MDSKKQDSTPSAKSVVRFGLPKGRMADGIFALLSDGGIRVKGDARGYRPTVNLPGFDVKILKPQNIVEMLHVGRRDVGFAGLDWVRELEADVVELLDTGLDPVRVVAAAPDSLLDDGKLPKRRLLVASEYERLTKDWISREGLDAAFVRSYGATEVFPPEDADCIVDNTSTGSTLQANRLTIVGEVMRSSTRLFANPRAMQDPVRREAIERLVLVLQSVLNARGRVMVEVNVSAEALLQVIAQLPGMREPTVSPLHGSSGFAVKAAVARQELPVVIPAIKAAGGTDVVVTKLAQIVP